MFLPTLVNRSLSHRLWCGAQGLTMKLQPADAAHLLRRFAFGATSREMSDYSDLNKNQAVAALLAGDTPIRGLDPSQIGNAAVLEAQEHWLAHLYDSAASATDRQHFFWHDHFSIISRKVRSGELTWEVHGEMRRLALANFDSLLRAVSFSPAMMIHLDNHTNVTGSPQENFARELLELHTIGNGSFSESDVVAMAQAWTGHGLSGSRGGGDLSYLFRRGRHDPSPATMFGMTKSWSAADTLDELTSGAKASDTARYLVRKLLDFYVGDHVGQALVNDLAAAFRDDDMNVRRLLRGIADLDEFWAPAARYSRVRSPLEYTMSLSRAMGVAPADSGLRAHMLGMGMELFQPPGVAGWGSHTGWISTSNTWAKERWLRALAVEVDEDWGLGEMTQVDAVSELLRRMGIHEPLAQTPTAVSNWLGSNAALRSDPRQLQIEAIGFAGHLPEVQLS